MSKTKSWRDKATYSAITTKLNRKKNPVTSYAQLAREFGAPVSEGYYSPAKTYSSGYKYSGAGSGPAASSSFRQHVKSVLGKDKVFA